MKCSFISDIHIRHEGDKGSKVLEAFLSHKITQESDKVFFLGDIFEVLIGEHKTYIEEYPTFFNGIIDLVNSGKEVIFIEGNHDFHFKKVITDYISEKTTRGSFHYLLKGEDIILNDKKYYYCHGYEVDYHNKYFKRWHRVYTSSIFSFFVSNILTHKLIKKLGESAAKDSKRRGKKSFDKKVMEDRYIEGAKSLIKEKNIQGVIAGHTHINAFHTFEDEKIYINCGFPIRDKHFLAFNGESFEKVELSIEEGS